MRQDLVQAVKNYTDRKPGINPVFTGIDGFLLLRSDTERRPNHLIYKPSLCVTVQGSKCIMFGGKRYDYGAGRALLVSVKLPAVGRVVEASVERPYLGFIIELDMATMREVIEELESAPILSASSGKGLLIIDFEGPLSDCALRMMRLLDTPKAIPVLAPAIMREICFWLLTGPNGAEIYQVVMATGLTKRVVDAVYALRDRYAEPIRIEELAKLANMSASAFHQRFKVLTGTTPLQYQKQIRLLEARRLLLTSEINVELAAIKVGYESASQFTRDYARMFGNPPRRDVALFSL